MSINAINSVSLYEYYYTINQNNRKKKSSPISKDTKEHEVKAADDDKLDVKKSEKAEKAEKTDEKDEQTKEIPYSERPWADLMYQLGISFNPDPKDDIQDIKDRLTKLTAGILDEELINEVEDLKYYVERLYRNFMNNSLGTIHSSDTIAKDLNNLSMLNKVNLK